MLKDTHTTDVMFRRYKDGQIIALMPNEVSDLHGNVTSYMHVGQHSGADYGGVLMCTRPANELESADLKAELEGLGYNVKVVKKQNRTKYLASLKEVRK